MARNDYLCEVEECHLIRIFLSLLPSGTLWDHLKQDIIENKKRDYYHMGDVAKLLALLYLRCIHSIESIIQEHDPLTANRSVNDWLLDYGWVFSGFNQDFSTDGLFAQRKVLDENGFTVYRRATDVDLSDYDYGLKSNILAILYYSVFSPINFNVEQANRLLSRLGTKIEPGTTYDKNHRKLDDYLVVTFTDRPFLHIRDSSCSREPKRLPVKAINEKTHPLNGAEIDIGELVLDISLRLAKILFNIHD